CYWHGAAAYSGVGLHIRLSSAPSAPEFSHPHFDTETRIVQARVGDTLFASVYVPNGGKDYAAKIAFLHSLIDYAADVQKDGTKLVICGDLNIARSDLDVHPKERKPNNIGWRLDYVLASQALASRATACPSYREIGTSDHAPVVATFE